MAKRDKKKKKKGGQLAFVPAGSGRGGPHQQYIDMLISHSPSKKATLNWVNEVVGNFTDRMAVKAFDGIVGYIGGLNSGGVNTGKPNVPFIERETERKRFSGVGMGGGRIYKTNFETGIPSSKSIETLSRLNGTRVHHILDTQSSSLYASGLERDNLSTTSGFGEKRVTVFSDANFKTKDLFSLYGLSNWSNFNFKNQRAYGLSKYIETKLKVMNTGSYFRAKVKIHLFAPTQTNSPSVNAIAAIFPTTAEFDTDTQGDCIPLINAFSAAQTIGNRASGLMDPKESILGSPDFRRQYSLEKSFTKVLQPGDIWDWRMKTNLGSGLRLEVVRDTYYGDPDSLENYLIVIEQEGSLCEGVMQADESQSYIGLSPSYLTFGFSKTVESVINPTAATGTYSTTNDGGYETRLMVKTYTERPPNGAGKRFHIEESAVGPKGSVADLFIPVMSDMQVNYAGEKSTAN